MATRSSRNRVARVAAGVCVGALAAWITPAGAVPAHRHCLITPGSVVEVAEGVVDQAPHETAFEEFHAHVHRAADGIDGEGPVRIVGVFLSRTCESLAS